MKSIKLASYNILSGCFENYEQSAKITSRFGDLQKALKAIDADFIGLIDTFKWKKTFSAEDLSEKFGYKNVFHIDMEDTRVGKEVGVAVMTNLDVKKFNVIRGYNRNYIKTVLSGLTIYTCYLDDLSENTRLLEVKALLDKINSPAIIHGDLNSFTLEDLAIPNKIQEEFVVSNPELTKKLDPVLNEMKRGEVVETLKTHGFIDSAKEFKPTMPSKLFPAVVKAPFIRVDYIFHTKDVFSDHAEVYTADLFDTVSDHYPISAVLKY